MNPNSPQNPNNPNNANNRNPNHAPQPPHPSYNSNPPTYGTSHPAASSMNGSNPPSFNLTNRNASTALNNEILRLANAFSYPALLALINSPNSQADMSPINYATAISRLGRVKRYDRQAVTTSPLFHQYLSTLQYHLETNFDAFELRHISNIVHSLGKLEFCHEGLLNIVVQNTQAIVENNKAVQGVSNICWGLANIPNFTSGAEFFLSVLQRSEWILNEGSPQELANVAWSVAKAGINGPSVTAFFNMIEQSAINGTLCSLMPDRRNEQDIANLLWAAGTLKIPLRGL